MGIWEEMQTLSRAVSWPGVAERCGFEYRENLKSNSTTKVSQVWVHKGNADIVLIIKSESGTSTLTYGKTGRKKEVQKQELITEILGNGEFPNTLQILKNWDKSVFQEIRELLPQLDDVLEETALELEGPGSDNEAVKRAVEQRLIRFLVDHQAERIFKTLDPSGEVNLPLSDSLDDFLSREYEDSGYVIDELMVYGATVFMVAAAKTGKTSVNINLIESVADGTPFLGVFEVRPIRGRIAFLDFELDERMAQTWYKRIGILNTDKVEHFAFRGYPNPFSSPTALNQLAEQLKFHDIEFLIIDPFSSIFSGNPNDNGEVKEFLKQLDAFKVKAGVKHLVVSVHAGRDQSKTRGASTLDDHPDALWYLSKDSEGRRIFRAIGRDVDIPESYLAFDSSRGGLTLQRGSKIPDTFRAIQLRILRFVKANPGLNATDLDHGVAGNNSLKGKARADLVRKGEMVETPGPRGAKYYHLGSLDQETAKQL